MATTNKGNTETSNHTDLFCITEHDINLECCVGCGLHVGPHCPLRVCGACRDWVSLSRGEWRDMRELARKHLGGTLRKLLRPSDYRPTLCVTTGDEEANHERRSLADYYDRIQSWRRDPRRAVRT